MKDENKITKEDLDTIEEIIKSAVENNNLILASEGHVFVVGPENKLLSNLTMIMNTLIESGTDKDLMQKAVDLAGLSTEELAQHAKESIEKLMHNLMNQD